MRINCSFQYHRINLRYPCIHPGVLHEHLHKAHLHQFFLQSEILEYHYKYHQTYKWVIVSSYPKDMEIRIWIYLLLDLDTMHSDNFYSAT